MRYLKESMINLKVRNLSLYKILSITSRRYGLGISVKYCRRGERKIRRSSVPLMI